MAIRGKKPTPTHLKLVTGNPGKRALPKNEPKPELAIPPVPRELCDDAKLEWGRVSVELHKLGLLSNIDRASLAAYCSSYGLWIRAMRKLRKKELDDPEYGGLLSFSAKGNIMSEPLVGIANKAAADMVRYAEQFGMTPSARARVNGSEAGNRSQDPAASYIG
jgi:P27 family predicted phage terminase small subunit